MRINRTNSIKNEFFKSSIIFSLLILIIFVSFFSFFTFNSQIEQAHSAIKQNNKAINFSIEGYVRDLTNLINFLSERSSVRFAYKQDSKKVQEALKMYRSLQSFNRHITYIYSGYKDGSLLINNYIPPKGFNCVIRPWYKTAMKTKPDASVGEPYQEAKSKEWLISFNKALINDNNEYVGVVSIDTSLEFITDLLRDRSSGYFPSYSYIIKNNGKIIIHHKKKYLRKKLSSILNRSVLFDKKEGIYDYEFNGLSKISYYSKVEGTDWIIITVVNKKEIFLPIVKKILLIALLTGLIAIAIGFALSRFFDRRFSMPIIELKKGIDSIINGKWSQNDYKFPDNELGTMAKQIATLFEILSDKISDGVILTDAFGTIVKSNRAAENLIGYNPEKVTINEVFPGFNPQQKADNELVINELGNIRMVDAQKTNQSILAYSTDLYDDSKNLSGFLLVFKNNDIHRTATEKFNLTYREIELIILLNDDLSYKDIASELDISLNTVRNHIQNIYLKTGVNKVSALLKAVFQ